MLGVIPLEKNLGGLVFRRAGSVEHGVFDELDDTGVGNGGFLLQIDGGAADDGGLEEYFLP